MSTTETTRGIYTAPQLPPEAQALLSLPSDRFREALLATNRVQESSPYVEQLLRLALHLVLEAPVGPPSNSVEFMARMDVEVLAEAWHGDTTSPDWPGMPIADLLIEAVANRPTDSGFSILSALFMQCDNAFTRWTTDPRTLRWAVTAAGRDPVPGSAGYWDIPALPLPTTTEKEN